MTEVGYKRCTVCGLTSNQVRFGRNCTGSYCYDCRNTHKRLLRKLKKENPYPVEHTCSICGVSEDEIPAVYCSSGNRIAPASTKPRAAWVLDHDHATGKFRGYLCQNCNSGLGKFKDNPITLLKAVEYLQDFALSRT